MQAAKGGKQKLQPSCNIYELQQQSERQNINKVAISGAHRLAVNNSCLTGLKAHSTRGKLCSVLES